MARTFRLWEKKRGTHRTGSPVLGGVGEALFYSVLFLMGTISFAVLLTARAVHPVQQVPTSGVGFYLLLLVSVSLILIGGGGVTLSLLQFGASVERRLALAKNAPNLESILETDPSHQEFPSIPDDADHRNSPGISLSYRLPATQNSVWQFVWTGGFCVVWNIITAVLMTLIVNGITGPEGDWRLTLVAIPILATGCWANYFFVRQLLLVTVIGPTAVEVSDHPLLPGGEYQLFISQAGRLTMNSFAASLICQEQATFRQGTDIRTETREVFRRRLFEDGDFEIDPSSPFEHRGSLTIPSSAMHSFEGDHNQIRWFVLIEGDAATWPNFERNFPIIVHPKRLD